MLQIMSVATQKKSIFQAIKSLLILILILWRFYETFFVLQEGWTPLHIAVQSRNRDITKILLTNGADKTRRTKVLMAKICAKKNWDYMNSEFFFVR